MSSEEFGGVGRDVLLRLFDAASDTVTRLLDESRNKDGSVDWGRFHRRIAENVAALELATSQFGPGSVN